MEEIGAYAFITPDFEQKGYPFDLWLDWNSRFFDSITVVSYGETRIALPDNVTIKVVDPPEDKGWIFYTKGKQMAQESLGTKWKIMLDTDEFLNQRIDTTDLDESKIYALNFHHLYGNINTEIIGAFPEFYFRVHTGRKKVINDGGSVAGLKDWGHFSFRKVANQFLEAQNGIFDEVKKLIYLVKKDGAKRAFMTPQFAGEVFHTNTLRDPKLLKIKWKEQSARTLSEGRSMSKHDSLEKETLAQSASFDYSLYKNIWEHATLKFWANENLPEVLIDNNERFNWYQLETIR